MFKQLNRLLPWSARGMSQLRSTDVVVTNQRDSLFSKVQIEVRGHDKAVLLSYTNFLKNACQHLELDASAVRHLPYHKWIQPLLRSKFAHKKYKVHYEVRTHIKQLHLHHLTGSTASAFLEYAQRNIPEGVAMRVDYTQMQTLPQATRPNA